MSHNLNMSYTLRRRIGELVPLVVKIRWGCKFVVDGIHENHEN